MQWEELSACQYYASTCSRPQSCSNKQESGGACSSASLLVVGSATLLVEVKGNKPETLGGLAEALCLILESFCKNAL